MADAATATDRGHGRHQRHLRNYLLDARFQLKYSGYLVAIALILSAVLGFILWRTSNAVIAQSHAAVNQGEQVVALGREVVTESQKVSAVVQMNIVRDPIYSDNPALLEAFKADADEQDQRLVRQQKALEAQSQSLKQQSIALAARQHTLLTTLCVVLLLLVIGIGLGGIVVTHKVAGPIYKMKRQIREVGEGRLTVPGSLRKGDELVDFFETFNAMVRSLRSRQEHEIQLLDAAISKLEGNAREEELEPLRTLRRQMQDALET